MALLEVNFFSKALMRPVTMNVILPADKVFFEEETEEDNKPFKTLYFYIQIVLHTIVKQSNLYKIIDHGYLPGFESLIE